MNSKKAYLQKLDALVCRFNHERRERFFPFHLIFQGNSNHRRFVEALSVGKYFLDNAMIQTPGADRFYKALKTVMEQHDLSGIDYWDFADKTPLPMQDYLKVVYDLDDGVTSSIHPR